MAEPQSAFHVIGFADADTRQMKAELALAINARLDELGVKTQRDATERLGMAQGDVSLLLRGVTRKFTIDRILQALQYIDPTARVSVLIQHEPAHV
jgi:predicted XRE-type DNA-binding protein